MSGLPDDSGRELEHVRQLDNCPECNGQGGYYTEWSDSAESDPILKAMVLEYPEPPDGTVYIRCSVCHDNERELERVRQLRGDELETYLIFREWYAQPNDLIGGYCVMPVDLPPSSGWPEIATFMSEGAAKHIAHLHNCWHSLRSTGFLQ